MTRLQGEILPSTTAMGDLGQAQVTPSRAEVMGDDAVPGFPPANTSHPLFGGTKPGEPRLSPSPSATLPSLSAKLPHHHLFLNPAQSKQGLRSSNFFFIFFFFLGAVILGSSREAEAPATSRPGAAREAAHRPQAATQAAEEREGRRAGSPCKVCPVLSNNTRCHCIPKSVPGALFITTETQNPAGQKRQRERETREGREAAGQNLPI